MSDRQMKAIMALLWALVVAIVAAVALWPAAGHAQDDDGRWAAAPPHVKQWFNQQKNIAGQYCCDETEARAVEDWSHGPDGYRVTLDGQSHLVNPAALDLTRSITGEPLVWIYPKGAAPSTASIRCFIPGDEG